MTNNYLVIRLTPAAPVDGATFATYLEDLKIQVFPAYPPPGTPPQPLGNTVYASPLVLSQVLGLGNIYLGVVSKPTSASTPRVSSTDYGNTLEFASTDGIAVGSQLFSAADKKDNTFFFSGATVTAIDKQSVTLSHPPPPLPKYAPAGTIASFIIDYGNVTPWATDPPVLSIALNTSADAAKDATEMPFTSAKGISVGMAVSPLPGIIDSNTTVIAANKTSVTLSKPLLDKLPKNTAVTFTFNLSSGIIQHIEPLDFDFFGFSAVTPAAVATAIVELNAPPPNGYLDVSVKASRGGKQIALDSIFYNVSVSTDALPTPDQYQFIPSSATSFYVTLPPPPINSSSISLTLPSDGSAPPYLDLHSALEDVLKADPISTLADIAQNGLTASQCNRLAYDIIWSQQNILPAPPDPLEQLYTNPPNSGSSSGDSGNDEQDRQKFEGNLKSFYATRNAEAQHLAGFIYSLATALFSYEKSKDVTSVRFEFPIIDENTTLTTIKEAAVVLTRRDASNQLLPVNSDFTPPGSAVPAECFYVLGLGLPAQNSPLQQYQMAVLANAQQVIDKLKSAINAGIINGPQDPTQPPDPSPLPITPEQAARNLAALGVLANTDPECPLNIYSDIQPLVQAWLNVLGDDAAIDTFWKGEVTSNAAGYLDLVLCLVTNNYAALINAIKAGVRLLPPPNLTHQTIPVKTVAELTQLQVQEWEAFFAANPNLLPDFTAPGPIKPKPTNPKAIKAQADVFARNLQSFFQVSAGSSQVPSANPNVPPTFYRENPNLDPIQEFITAYPGFAFGPGLDPTQTAFQTALDAVFSHDPPARAWLEQTMLAINALYILTTGIPQPPQPNTQGLPDLRFSVMEALYARGFTSLQSVLDLSPDDFQQALTGTVAYSYAITTIQANAGTWQPGQSVQGGFQPINPNGCLVNCIPPFYLSPLGPPAYLQEMLKVSETSTCENPQPENVENTLGQVIAQRRGKLGSLQVTEANLETPLPLIDIVNECLEAIAAQVPLSGPPAGVVYNTASDMLDEHQLCSDDARNKHDSHAAQDTSCHKPATLFATTPQYSSPATPVAQPGAYDRLKNAFSSCHLPYSQPLDINRSYLGQLETSRYAVMRRFRKDITEFVLDPGPADEPAGFQRQLWRYPVRIEIAREYLGITPEEYALLFTQDIATTATAEQSNQLLLWQVYGYDLDSVEDRSWYRLVVRVSEFLKRTCLTYCEFLELWKSGFVKFQCNSDQREGENAAFPECEPCCLDNYFIQFEDPENPNEALKRLAVFIRLWRKLQHVKNARYSFTQLCDICNVLNLFTDGSINPDFIRQLAAFQMLRDHLGLRLTDNTRQPAGASGADRTSLLALWVGIGASKWTWAVQHLLDRLQHYARKRHQCGSRPAHFIKLLAENLDPLSLLAGFDPTRTTDTWHALPTHTLRFAEVLSKIYASDFSVGEILFLFTAGNHLEGDDPFPLPDDSEALDCPLAFPDDEEAYSLQALRRKLLAVSVSQEEAERWTWRHIEASMRYDFGYEPTTSADPLLSIGEHFFPGALSACGNHVDMKQRQYRVSLPDTGPNATNPAMWNTPDSPFRYDTSTTSTPELWIRLPLTDEEVFEKLSHIRQLNQVEQDAVQKLYFAPRVDLASFAFIFSNFGAAVEHLIQEENEEKRWVYFRHEFARCHARSHVIAEHLAHHVAAASGQEHPDGVKLAWRLLQHLLADENRATSPWEIDSGQVPPVTWQPQPNGGAFAALLDLTGTGLLGEFLSGDGRLVWNEMRGPMNAFGHEKNRWNIPVPTVLPAMDLTLSPAQARFAGIRNGFAMKGQNGEPLGSPQGFGVRWQGILLVECEGRYEFYAGSPTPEGERPDFEAAEQRRWRVTLKQGQKTWVVLSHHWPNTEAPAAHTAPLALRSGAYQITVEFTQPEAVFTQAETHRQHTGFQVKYCGPDSDDHLVTIPLDRLFRDKQDAPLGAGIDRGGPAEAFLRLHFTSTLRDMRRTYQRAFKALLFAHRFGLSAKPITEYGQSEIGYMLAHPDRFEGTSYYRKGQNSGFGTYHAYFDFNFLPLLDSYHAPSPVEDQSVPPDQRVQPSPQRQQALFDWWERIFDYVQVREETQHAREHPLWLLFDEAAEQLSDDPAQLLRHAGIDLDHADLTTHYYQGYSVTSDDLEDERWTIRAWRAEEWVRDLLSDFAPQNIQAARPDLWASDDPHAVLAGETRSGNDNLTRFVRDGCIENGRPRRYKDIERLNNELREHARRALLAYLCGMNRVPLPWGGYAQEADDLSALLLLDVEAGLRERASRIEEAISAVQTYIQRRRLGLDVGFNIAPEFIRLWDRCFASFYVWQAYKRREIYRENWIDWEEIQKAQASEAFRFLETELQRAMLTAPRPGGLEYWPDQGIPAHVGLATIQSREPAQIQGFDQPLPLPQPPQPEGFDLLGTPERDARLSWLSEVPQNPAEGNGNTDGIKIQAVNNPPPAQPNAGQELPLWIQAAIRLGVRFLRVAAAGEPPASTRFAPWHTESETAVCCECGIRHPAVVDEYYFWLINSRYYDDPDNPNLFIKEDITPPQDATWNWDTWDWNDPKAMPALLRWDSKPMVQLAWCRVHNGDFQQPRRSVAGVPLDGKTVPELQLMGRADDSLTFQVIGSILPAGYPPPPPAAPPPPVIGFRYDLATDETVTLPLVVTPPGTGATYPPGLSAYPFFAYFAPGSSIMPPSLFGPALAIAGALRAHCRFEEALKWYAQAFDPLSENCSWCSQEQMVTEIDTNPEARGGDGNGSMPCCSSIAVTDDEARNRSITLHYLEALHQWADALMHRNSPEAFQQARLILDTEAHILGMRPRSVMEANTGIMQQKEPPPVINFQPACAPLNPRLLALYDLVDDGLALIHNSLDARRLREGQRDRDRSYWGNTELRNGWQTAEGPCADEESCCPPSPYRFMFLIQKAQELASQVKELGAALLAAFEKGDAEYLASLRQIHERQLLELTLEIRQNQWREADWQVQALQKTQAGSQARRQYNALLIQSGLISGEVQHQALTEVTLSDQETGRTLEEIGTILGIIPDVNVGTLDFTTLPIGSKLQGVFSGMSQIVNSQAGSASTTGGLRLTQAGWDRREAEWRQQVQVLDIENEQIERQILAAERRRDIALRELNNHQQQMEHAAEVQGFLRDKFTNHALYLYLQQDTAMLYSRMYELALCTAQQAQRAFNYERGHTARRFLPTEGWDSLHEGLLAGERLQFSLRHMEKAYLDENMREYELAKHFSLRLHFPCEFFLHLIETGCCEIDIPEWTFDLDYPGHYMRRIRNVSLTIPCVVGPYTGVHCRLTLLRSMTRVHPRLRDPLISCCDDDEFDNGYRPVYDDPRIVTQYAATEAIATSSGQNDSGMFELNFRDERYLPFEFMGAVCRVRIELPHENNQFDIHSVTDVILHLNYTAREGGEVLRRAANEVAQQHLPGAGVRYFDIRHEFPDAWHRFQGGFNREEAPKHLGLRLSRDMFPFIPGHRELWVNRLNIFFEALEAEPGRHKVVKFLVGHRDGQRDEDRDDREVREINCVVSDEWPNLYHGVLDIRLGPLAQRADRDLGTFKFPQHMGMVSRVFLLCGYEVKRWQYDERPGRPQWHK